MLQGYYEEMETLGEPILASMQVRNLVPIIQHPKTMDIVHDIIYTTPNDEKELITIMSNILTKMSIVGVNPNPTT